jgi:hypothetical protein
MGVKASAEGIKKMEEAIAKKKLSFQNFAKMTMALNISERTLKKFLKGTEEVKKDTALAIIRYLGFSREEIISDSEWFKDVLQRSLEDLWQELCQLARYAPQQLGVVAAQMDTMALDDDGKSRFLTQVVSKSPVWMEIEVLQPGYLVLLDRDATGEIVCMSPSPYVPEYQIEAGLHRLPQVQSAKRVFKPSTLGDEVFLAALLPDEPDFEWLSVGEKCVRLEAADLQELLAYVKSVGKSVDLMRSQIKIVAA